MFSSIISLFLLLSLPKNEEICNLHGKVKIVQSNATYRIFIQNNNYDTKVKLVPSFPTKPGLWQIVAYGEDFTVQFVDNKALADFSIKFIPGVLKMSINYAIIKYPFFFTYTGAFKWYQALDVKIHPDPGKKGNMILISAYCRKRDIKIDVQLPYYGLNVKFNFDKDWPEDDSK